MRVYAQSVPLVIPVMPTWTLGNRYREKECGPKNVAHPLEK